MAEGDMLERSVMHPDKYKTMHKEIAKDKEKSPDKLNRSVYFRRENLKKLSVKEHPGKKPSQRTANRESDLTTLESLAEDVSETKQSVDKSTNLKNEQNKTKPLKRNDNLRPAISPPDVLHAQYAVNNKEDNNTNLKSNQNKTSLKRDDNSRTVRSMPHVPHEQFAMNAPENKDTSNENSSNLLGGDCIKLILCASVASVALVAIVRIYNKS